MGINTIGNHDKAFAGHAQPLQHIRLQVREHDDPVVAGQSWGIELIAQLLGSGREVSNCCVKGRMEGGDQGNPKLLAQFGKAEIERREGEAGVHQVGFQPFKGFAQFTLGPR